MRKFVYPFHRSGSSLWLLLVMASSVCWAASGVTSIYNFTGGDDGGDPQTWLTFDGRGNIYGTTITGGTFGYGTVFELSPSSGGQWTETVLYSFKGAPDGKNPYGGVTFDAAGNLYGATAAGGSGGSCTGDGCGTIFELSPSGNSWMETILYGFTGGKDGAGPGNGVVFDNAGNLFGTTPDGGLYSEGVVYELSPTPGGQWKQSVVHAFTGGNDGAVGSLGPLLFVGGTFYGVTELGGANKAGTVFQFRPSAGGGWTLTTLYAFQGQPDAGFPDGGVIADGTSLYGTTYFGGADNSGAVFRLSAANTDKVLYSFKGRADGGNPTSVLYFDQQKGKLYGTTSSGGNAGCDCGTVFELGEGGEATLHQFSNTPDGANPYYGLTPDASGNLYGSTAAGGTHGQGMVFVLTP
jgi:uncharacterized repeat protein (TIGR03803 family)